MNFYITGDTHGNFKRIEDFCIKNNTSKQDVMIILGDAGINYYLNKKDKILKEKLKSLPITLLCIHGNHEERPQNIKTYITKQFLNGKVMYEEDYDNILFAIDGEVYNINNNNVLVIGGAYSVDKFYRLSMGYKWFKDEQPSDDIKHNVEEVIQNKQIDIVLSHTCPYRYEQIEWFIKGLDQSAIDKATEKWLDRIYDKVNCKHWYCGHFHGEKEIDNLTFMYESIIKL